MIYIVRCRSYISGIESVCKRNGKILVFNNKEDAEKYAEARRNEMGLNFHYWVEPKEVMVI